MKFDVRNRCLVLLSILAIGTSRASAQTVADFFDDSIVQEIRLAVRASDWATLKQRHLENTYYTADFRWRFRGRDIAVSNVGIRSRGHGSRSPVKPSLGVHFDRFESTQAFLGMSSILLKPINQDASFVRERVTVLLFKRMGLPTQLDARARLYINDEYSGLYLLMEDMKKPYLRRNFNEDDGYLYDYNF